MTKKHLLTLPLESQTVAGGQVAGSWSEAKFKLASSQVLIKSHVQVTNQVLITSKVLVKTFTSQKRFADQNSTICCLI